MTLQSFQLHFSVSALEKWSKNLSVNSFFPSRKYVAEQGIIMIIYCRLFSIFGFTSPFLLQKNSLKMLNIFLPLKEPLLATFSKASGLTSRKCVPKPNKSIPNLSDKLNFFGGTPPLLLQKTNLKIQVFRVFLPAKEALVASFT